MNGTGRIAAGVGAAALLLLLLLLLFGRTDPPSTPMVPESATRSEVESASRSPAPTDRTAPVTGDLRCRCAPRDLADYWATADEVTLARLVTFDESERYRLFRMVLEAPPWKTDRPGGTAPARADTVEYRTPVSTATCGVQPEIGAVYAIFARRSAPDSAPDSLLDIDTCSGTRVYRGADGSEQLGGFRDVPGRFVVRQLDALAGLDALRGVARLPAPTDTARAVLRGLLDLEPLAHGGVVRVFEEPDPTSDVLATIDGYEAVTTREVGYEVDAAVVFGCTDGWSRVQLSDGRHGWVAPDEAGTWFPYAALPIRRLAYLTPAWSGWVWPAPGAGIPARVHPSTDRVGGGAAGDRSGARAREVPVEVLEARRIAGIPWFRVSVLAGSPCEGAGDVRPVAGGWVPGYGPTDDGVGLAPTIWYWSRGC